MDLLVGILVLVVLPRGQDHDLALADSVVAGLREAAVRIPADELRTRLDGVARELTAALPREVAEWGLRTLEVRVSESTPQERRASMSRTFRLARPPSGSGGQSRPELVPEERQHAVHGLL